MRSVPPLIAHAESAANPPKNTQEAVRIRLKVIAHPVAAASREIEPI
jgi:hypothetical protein